MADYESLLERIRQSPKEHLGKVSVSRIRSYTMGYDFARQFWGLPVIHHRLYWEKYREWQESKIHLCRQNLESFCLLVCEDEKQAFDLFFEFQDLALEECKADLIIKEDLEVKEFDQVTAIKSSTLVDFILNKEGIRKRPAMYFGNGGHLSGLWAMCSGFLWAERDLGIIGSSDALNMELFQLWVEDRYPIGKGQTWDKIFYFNRINSDSWAMENFYEDFEMFLQGKESDSPPEWIEKAVESIKKLQDDNKNEN